MNFLTRTSLKEKKYIFRIKQKTKKKKKNQKKTKKKINDGKAFWKIALL